MKIKTLINLYLTIITCFLTIISCSQKKVHYEDLYENGQLKDYLS